LRRFLTAILLFGLTGSGVELMLLNHHEDLKQAIPLALIGAAFLALLWLALAGSRPAVWGLRAVMSLFVFAGLLGVALHFQSTLEFQREIDPSLRGFDLVMKALRAKAPPALAPGVMIQLGLIGLALTYRHPSLGPAQPMNRNHGE
jgi:drug/metabolite transporter superfamily protein YnfA